MTCYAQSKLPAIGFFDSLDQLITSYDPQGFGFHINSTQQWLNDGESLIGVYGVRDKEKWFTSFGFIVATLPGVQGILSQQSSGVFDTNSFDSQRNKN